MLTNSLETHRKCETFQHFLRRNTSISIPEIYRFGKMINNQVNAPFIMMEVIEGLSVTVLYVNLQYKVWTPFIIIRSGSRLAFFRSSVPDFLGFRLKRFRPIRKKTGPEESAYYRLAYSREDSLAESKSQRMRALAQINIHPLDCMVSRNICHKHSLHFISWCGK